MRRLAAALLAACVAALSLALAVYLSAHHPLSPALALTGVLLLAVLAAAWPLRWPLWSLALLPVLGLMPWTGWVLVEELDLVLLATLAGGYARWAVQPAWAAGGRSASLQVAWLMPLLMSMVLSLGLGLADAGGWQWGWWQAYREPLNSLRLFKPLLACALLLPLCARGLGASEPAARAWEAALAWGMVALLGAVALGVCRERWAYTGLLDFSSDYRATGPFWEMHVGGAALDAVLALAMPFALLALLRVPGVLRWLATSLVLALGAYASLVTFSRIVYVAVPGALLLTAWLWRRQRPGGGAPDAHRWTSLTLLAMAVFGLAWWLFPVGGYRSLLALLGAVALLLPLAEPARRTSARGWARALMLWIPASAAVLALVEWVPKGAYLGYAGAWLSCAQMVARQHASPEAAGRAAGPAQLASFGAVCVGLVAVGVHWGGGLTWVPGLATAAVLSLALLVVAARTRPSWPTDWRTQAQAFGVMLGLAVLVAVFSGGDYMSQRLTQARDDSSGRQQHWRRALSWLDGADWLVGKGLGRFPTHFGLSGRTEDQVGDYRLDRDAGGAGQVLVLTSGKHILGHGEQFRLAQRIPSPARGPLKLDLRIRAPLVTELHVEVCTRHLLYPLACAVRNWAVPRASDDWQSMSVTLEGPVPDAGHGFSHRWTVFALALGTPGRRVELDALDLRDGQGQPLLANGDFEQGMARWFSSSDRHHMPWHAKSFLVHVLFEQGLLGVAAWSLGLGVALWRLTVGAARQHRLAPALAGALVGVLLVGLVDSLLDMPRVAWLLGFLLMTALLLPGEGLGRQRAHRPRPLSGWGPRAL